MRSDDSSSRLARLLPARGDDGVALILVISWSVVILGILLVLANTVIRQIVPSDRAERSFDALAAAEAGIEDYRARLLVDGVYYRQDDPTNPALGGWAAVPGGNTTAQFTYAIDSSRAGTGGGITIISTGRARGETRTVKAVLARRSILDYVYMSDIESTAPYMPAAYSDAPGSGGTNAAGQSQTAQQLAEQLCARHWWDMITGNALVSPPSTAGKQRNLNFCQYADITSSELLEGPVHTNDIFRLSITSLTTNKISKITSSCPSTASQQVSSGQGPGGILCPAVHRFIDGNGNGYIPPSTAKDLSTSAQVNGNYMSWTKPTAYTVVDTLKAFQGSTWQPDGSTNVAANPGYDTPLKLPQDPKLLMPHASIDGCVFTGPTRIRFEAGGTAGYMIVTSPDTKHTNPLCAGGSSTGLAGVAGVWPQPTQKIDLSLFTNLVIYVQNVVTSATTDDPKNDWDKDAGQDNVWTTTTPTCTWQPTKLISASGTVGSLSGSGPWTANVTGMATTSGLGAGAYITATNGTGASGGSIGAGGTYLVTAVNSSSSISIKAVGGTAPKAGPITAITRTSTKYPYIVPDPAAAKDPPASSNFTLAGNTYGFPSQFAPVGSAFFGSNCALGDVYVEGNFLTSVTIAADQNVIITNDLKTTAARQASGAPAVCTATYCPMMGLVSNWFTYIYRPLVADNMWVGDWPAINADRPIIDAAILAVNQCLCSQREFSTSASLVPLTIWGSLAQKYRCPVGQPGAIVGGYTKAYHRDTRLNLRTPPFLTELSYEPWKRNAYSEITLKTQSKHAAPNPWSTTWTLATASDPASTTFANLTVAYGSATAAFDLTGKKAVVTYTGTDPVPDDEAAIIVLSYDATNAAGIIENRHRVIHVE